MAVKLSTKGRYAVMAMADLARHTGEGQSDHPVPLGEIAQRQEISLHYLEQLFGKLRRGGLVVAVRGPRGGYRLAQPAAELRIADIILAVNEPIKSTRCKSESTKGCLGRTGRCLTHDLWEELGRQIEVFLASVTLADVLEHRVLGRARPLERAGAPRVIAQAFA
jgi:Rrf2 family iron-sulfur cluster assembly transcriptional regulator